MLVFHCNKCNNEFLVLKEHLNEIGKIDNTVCPVCGKVIIFILTKIKES